MGYKTNEAAQGWPIELLGNHWVMYVKLSILIQMVALFGDGCRDDISIGHCL
jgi:hypothetical protein